MRVSAAIGAAAVFAGLSSGTAEAVDLLGITEPVPIDEATLPAVSGVNGKLEFDGGYLSVPDGDLMGRLGASLSLPVGPIGLQGDLVARYTDSEFAYGGALHAFARDPGSYLIGVTAAAVRSPGTTVGAIGPEAELYFDRVSIEAWLGYTVVNYDAPALDDLQGYFGFGDIAFYPTDDLRLALGGSYLLGDTALYLGTEYQFPNLPFSATADLRYGLDGDYSATVGVKGYFGGGGKSLIERHRQDDPANRGLTLLAAAEGLIQAGTNAPSGDTETADDRADDLPDTDAECESENGPGYVYDPESDDCIYEPPPPPPP